MSRLRRDAGEMVSAVIDGTVQNRYGHAEQKITVRLTAAQHVTAIEAYRTRRPVRLVGEARGGRVDAVLSLEVAAADQ